MDFSVLSAAPRSRVCSWPRSRSKGSSSISFAIICSLQRPFSPATQGLARILDRHCPASLCGPIAVLWPSPQRQAVIDSADGTSRIDALVLGRSATLADNIRSQAKSATADTVLMGAAAAADANSDAAYSLETAAQKKMAATAFSESDDDASSAR